MDIPLAISTGLIILHEGFIGYDHPCDRRLLIYL